MCRDGRVLFLIWSFGFMRVLNEGMTVRMMFLFSWAIEESHSAIFELDFDDALLLFKY